MFYVCLDNMLTELNDRFLCHRTHAFALQCRLPKFTQTSSLIDMQPAIKLYQNVLSGTTFDVEAEFALWRAITSGNISADNAFDVFECCPSVYPNTLSNSNSFANNNSFS